MAALLACFAGSFAVWDPLDVDERAHIHRITRHSAEGARADLEGELRGLLGSQALLARSWAANEGLTRQEWEYEAGLFLESHDSCILVEWRDHPSGELWRLHRAEPRGSDAGVLPALDPVPDGDARASFSHRLGPVFRLPNGKPAAATFVTIRRNDASEGRLTAVFDLERMLDGMLADHRELGYALSVEHRADLLYRSADAASRDASPWAEQSTLRLPGADWRLRVWPSAELLAAIRSPLPELAFVVGGLLGVLLVLAIRSARAAFTQSRELARARDEVERRVVERTSELGRVNGTLRAEVMDRARAESALRKLSARLLSLQDEERRRLARELHDSTAQTLAAVAVALERTRKSLDASRPEDAGALLHDGSELLDQVSAEIRTLSFLLHPPVLDDLGLEYALPWFAQGFSRRSGIDVRVKMPSDLGRLPEDVETALYRVVQESLANVHHHSGSATAEIAITRCPGFVSLEVTDHGRGLEPGIDRLAVELGVGIPGMRERVRQLGGDFDVVSAQGGGTLVRAVLPLPATVVAPQGHGSVGTAA